MDIGKNVNLSKLRETLHGIFTVIYSFWILIGSVFFILITFFFVFIYPLSGFYNRAYNGLNDLIMALEQYAFKKDIYNDKWIASKKQEADLYDKEHEKCKSFLKEKDSRLEAFFLIEDPEKGMVEIEDEAIWKNEYLKRVSALLAKLEANNITVSEGALPFQTWGSDIPTWDTILPVQKRFWILESLVNIATNNTGVIRIERITFRESVYTYDSSLANIYSVIPITLKVELQSDRIKYLLYEILKSDIPFVIEGINILSTDKIFNPGSLTESEGTLIKDTDKNLLNPIIDIAIDAYVIDYKT